MNDKVKDEFDPFAFGGEQAEFDPAAFGGMQFQDLDEETGADWEVRGAVGAAPRAGKLATLRMYYPGAEETADGNYVYWDENAKRHKLFNPPGMDFGDLAENKRMLFEAAGGWIGGTLPAILGQAGPQALTPEEAVTIPAGIAAGTAIGGRTYDFLEDLFGTHVGGETFNEALQTSSIDVGATAMFHKAGDVVAEGVKRQIRGGSDKSKDVLAGAVYDVFNRMGAQPTPGMIASGNVLAGRTIQRIEKMLEGTPGATDVYGLKYSKVLEAMDNFALNWAKEWADSPGSPAGKEKAGEQIRSGVDGFVRYFSEKGGELYKEADALIGNPKAEPHNLRATVNSMKARYADDPEEWSKIMDETMVDRVFNALEASAGKTGTSFAGEPGKFTPGGVHYNTLKGLRTQIGDAINFDAPVGDTSTKVMKDLYIALTQDMEAIAGGVSEEAGMAMARANSFWSAGRGRIDDVLWPMVRNMEGGKVYNNIFREGKLGQRKMRALKKSIPEKAWNRYVGEFIVDMGRADPVSEQVGNAFSPARFLRNYETFRRSGSIEVMFGKELTQALDDLLVASRSMKDLDKYTNYSQSGDRLIAFELFTTAVGAMGAGISEGDIVKGAATGAMIGSAPWATAQLMTNPKFVKWLADSSNIPNTQNGIASHMTRLYAIGHANPAIKDSIDSYIAMFGERVDPDDEIPEVPKRTRKREL